MNHLEFAAIESAALSSSRAWQRWVAAAEKLLGHDLDGDQDRDGYSIDFAYDAYRSGYTAELYVSDVLRRKANRASAPKAGAGQ